MSSHRRRGLRCGPDSHAAPHEGHPAPHPTTLLLSQPLNPLPIAPHPQPCSIFRCASPLRRAVDEQGRAGYTATRDVVIAFPTNAPDKGSPQQTRTFAIPARRASAVERWVVEAHWIRCRVLSSPPGGGKDGPGWIARLTLVAAVVMSQPRT